nr:MAG TPA: hypothetical protein [Caudoviricetes sp.]
MRWPKPSVSVSCGISPKSAEMPSKVLKINCFEDSKKIFAIFSF